MADSIATNPWTDIAAGDGILLAQADVESGAAHEAADAAHGDAHGEAHSDGYGEADWSVYDSYSMPHELPHAGMFIEAIFNENYVPHHGARPHPQPYGEEGGLYFFWVNPLFTLVYGAVIIWLLSKAFRNASVRKPGKAQMFAEVFLGGLRNFFNDILGPGGNKHIPFFGTMWLFILMNNLGVLIPLGKSPTASFKLTIMCAVVTMVYARIQNLKEGGFIGYLYHLAGSPKDVVTWCLAPVMFLIEAVGELTKTLSLGLRLFGATMGEDKLLAVFMGLGMMIMAALLNDPSPIFGLPLHLPFFALLVPLMGTIQATILTLLGAIFMQLMMPHDDHGEHGHGDEHGQGGKVHAAESPVAAAPH